MKSRDLKTEVVWTIALGIIAIMNVSVGVYSVWPSKADGTFQQVKEKGLEIHQPTSNSNDQS